MLLLIGGAIGLGVYFGLRVDGGSSGGYSGGSSGYRPRPTG